MEILDISPSDNNLWQQVWRLYVDSFPEYERRRVSSHISACDNEHFYTKIAVDNGHLMAIVFYWKSDNIIYIEHLAVNPTMRGRNVGSSILLTFLENNPDTTVILEIDPPVDEISQRRLSFYQRIGFVCNDFPYTHPSYSRNGLKHPLVIMSYPCPISQQQFTDFETFIKNTVLTYID